MNDIWVHKAALVIFLVICAVGSMGMLAEPTHVVIVERETSYNPDVIKIKLGQVLEVRNRDEFWHSSLISKSDENGFEVEEVFKKRRDRRGGQWKYTFEEAGIYIMRCTNHDGMTADIVVTE